MPGVMPSMSTVSIYLTFTSSSTIILMKFSGHPSLIILILLLQTFSTSYNVYTSRQGLHTVITPSLPIKIFCQSLHLIQESPLKTFHQLW